ncbi:MAG: hypothetical protein Q9161_001703 [Pseudevernia consocians]
MDPRPEKKTKVADSTPESFRAVITRLDEMTASLRRRIRIDTSGLEEVLALIRPSELLRATPTAVKADVSENNALSSEGNDPDAEQRDEDIISKGLVEEGESSASHDVDLSAPGYTGEEILDSADDSSIKIKAYLGETYTSHIMALNNVVAMLKPIDIVSSVVPPDWQLRGASKMRYLEQSSYRGGILADEMGLGKTLAVLLLINSTRSIRAGPSFII